MRKELLIFALKILQDECNRYTNCRSCPLYDEELIKCILTFSTPSEFNLGQYLDEEVEKLNI